MSFSFQSITEIEGRVLKVGQRWPRMADHLELDLTIVCTGLKPDAYEVEVSVGSFPAFTAGPYSSIEEADRAGRGELSRRLAKILSDHG